MVRKSLSVINLLLLVVLVVGIISLRMFHWSLLDVQTSSMQPTFRPHDLLVTAPVSATSQLRVGDVITYRSNNNFHQLVSHRLVQIDPTHHTFRTQGDALAYPDPLITPASVVGRAVYVVPKGGAVLERLKTPIGLAVILYFPVALLLAAEIRRLGRTFTRPVYRHPARRMV
jgi:signal peptidase